MPVTFGLVLWTFRACPGGFLFSFLTCVSRRCFRPGAAPAFCSSDVKPWENYPGGAYWGARFQIYIFRYFPGTCLIPLCVLSGICFTVYSILHLTNEHEMLVAVFFHIVIVYSFTHPVTTQNTFSKTLSYGRNYSCYRGFSSEQARHRDASRGTHSSEGYEWVDKISTVCWEDVPQGKAAKEGLVELGDWKSFPKREVMMLGR